MNLVVFFAYYFFWHYKKAYVQIFDIWKNFICFAYDFFSVGPLSKTLFSPWERMGEEYYKGESLEAAAETAIVNIIMRVVGFIIRMPVVIAGLAAVAGVFFVGILFFLLWTILPAVIFLFFIFGLIGIFK